MSELVLLVKGDYVVMNDKYSVSEENKGRVFRVRSSVGEVCGKLCVWLSYYPGAYAADGLTLITRDEAEDLLEKRIDEERLQELQSDYDNETSDEETQEWREDLTNEEKMLVGIWDRRFAEGVSSILETIKGETV